MEIIGICIIKMFNYKYSLMIRFVCLKYFFFENLIFEDYYNYF